MKSINKNRKRTFLGFLIFLFFIIGVVDSGKQAINKRDKVTGKTVTRTSWDGRLKQDAKGLAWLGVLASLKALTERTREKKWAADEWNKRKEEYHAEMRGDGVSDEQLKSVSKKEVTAWSDNKWRQEEEAKHQQRLREEGPAG